MLKINASCEFGGYDLQDIFKRQKKVRHPSLQSHACEHIQRMLPTIAVGVKLPECGCKTELSPFQVEARA